MLIFGGSEGGMSEKFTAALLASHGYPTLAIAYFNYPGLPASLRDIPLEYFATAARLLSGQPSVDPAHVVAIGYSRGSETALLLAQDFPDLVHGAVLYAPSAQVNPSFPDPSGNAWTRGGAPVPQTTIPIDHIDGPVLAIAGADDQLWPSAPWAEQIARELDQTHNPYPHRALIYPQAGHGVGTFPYLAAGTHSIQPVTGTRINDGGTRPGNATARAQGWPQTLTLIAAVST